MRKTAFVPLVTAVVCLLPVAPAQAQAPRTFVSASGSDSNNCTNVATPCRHFAAAYAATAPNGEIFVLDPANYGALTITGPVSIEGHGWASIAPAANSAAITINAPGSTDKINIIGVVLDGTGIANTTGIQFNSGDTLNVRDSVIRNFRNNGINFTPSALNSSKIFVSNTLISDNGFANGGDGITVGPTGSGPTTGVLNHVETENNAGSGLNVATGTATIKITVTDSVSANNSNNGIIVNSTGSTPVSIMVRNSTIANNFANGLAANGAGANISVTRSTITGNIIGWNSDGVGTVTSYGDNNIDGNIAGNTEPPNPLTYK